MLKFKYNIIITYNNNFWQKKKKNLPLLVKLSYKKVNNRVSKNLDKGDLEQALHEIASLRDPVDAFFDSVMVMDKEAKIRGNRLALLKHIADLFETIADFSKIAT